MYIPGHLALAAHLVTTSLLYAQPAAANVEKTIFIAPRLEPVPAESPVIDDLGLQRLSPEEFKLRTNLNASFPTQQLPDGTESWFFLEDLNPGQRYEVRVCWLATQPTAFTLDTYSLGEAMSSPAILSSLAKYSETLLASAPSKSSVKASNDKDYLYPPKSRRQPNSPRVKLDPRNTKDLLRDALTSISEVESVLFLRILAAADYYTANSTLMESVQPVKADIILDPFLLNVFPRSLVPTVIYALPVAVLVYFIGAYIAKTLSIAITTAGDDSSNKKEVKKDQ
ncbi:uncharacterized protein TRUGW13939_07877 [Talaromyces rugulosus]|uniref:Uncharacterized protein n=1 Tax=Talaromyces rugulosus TaxID=121627 RepID=A0A7H8R4X1_TALRU|nr:uncharacterized protein TRUGW13939_07877 [Talaromyces rugulosus]QKX60731.1 hypothetical protein TRUGW13939_07877 [Talaromyces rugulosus]